MKCILMNKNTPVVELELDEDTAAILKVTDVFCLDFLPVGIDTKTGSPNKKELNEWWLGRCIPASRSGIREALEKMNIAHSEELLLRCYGLSLSDQYWMRPKDSKAEWKDVNFFENDFSDDVGNVLFGHPASENMDLMSPCNTSDGWLRKKWKIIDGKRYLIKAGSNPFMQEPFNEVFGTRLHEIFRERLHANLHGLTQNNHYVTYRLLLEGNVPYSVCENFIDTHTELVSAVSINRSRKKRSQFSAYEHFINACTHLGIPGMREFVDYMLVFDFIMANTDRHFGNFGAIRNVETLEWIGPAPVFDSGTSLWNDQLTRRIDPLGNVDSKPFYGNADRQLGLVRNLDWVPFDDLKNIKEDVREIFTLSPYMDEERVEALASAVAARVEELYTIAKERKPRVF